MVPPSSTPSETREALAAALADKLERLLEIPSPSGAEGSLANLLEREIGALGVGKLQRFGDNLVLRVAGASRRPRLLLCGHLDTVPAQGNEKPHRDGDRIFGLGSSDLKAGLAVLWHLLERVPLAEQPGPTTFVFYTHEEVAFAQSGLILVEEQAPWIRAHDFAICVEPTANAVEIGCNGTLHAEITLCGKTSHSARPWLGHNAIHAAAPLLQRIANHTTREIRWPGPPPLLYREVMSVTQIEGGRARNVIPDLHTLNLNFRFGPDRSSDEAQRLVLDLVGDAGEVRFVDLAPAGRVSLDNPLCQRLVQRAGNRVAAKQAWTDVGRFSAWGLDAVSFGPGRPEKAHQQDEYANVSDMVRNYEIFEQFFQDISAEYPP